ncbi:MAG: aminoglycoside phosphotransferase [Actinomycetia bacterium]|nr:aminoglycoside phosphotransferase [Actinomycetes bacterium]
MPIPSKRDIDQVTRALSAWLANRLDDCAGDVVITGISAPASSGFSNETWIIPASWTDAAGKRLSEEFVVRVEPTEHQVFLEADFGRQHRLISMLDRDTDLPVPPMLWLEEDPGVFGAPFFVMRKVPGAPAPDQPSYNAAGWLADYGPEERHAVWTKAVDMLVRVHQVPVDTVAFLDRPELGATGFDQEFTAARRYYEWAAAGGRTSRIIEATYDWLERNLPQRRPTALSWGDARIGNMLFADGNVRAVLDWEMASLGGHEMDLGWWLFLDRFHNLLAPRLDGLGTAEETIARWEAGTGEQALDLEWYEVFAGFRFAIVMKRIAHLAGSDSEDSERNNPVLHMLARQLDLAPPGELPAGYRG